MKTYPFPKDTLVIFRSDLPVIFESLSLKNTAHKSNILLLHSASSDTIIAESKNTSSQHTLKYERESFFFFFGTIKVLTSCVKFASHRCPKWDYSWSGHGLLLLQKDEHPLHFLVLANPRCISYLHDHLFQSSNTLKTFL